MSLESHRRLAVWSLVSAASLAVLQACSFNPDSDDQTGSEPQFLITAGLNLIITAAGDAIREGDLRAGGESLERNFNKLVDGVQTVINDPDKLRQYAINAGQCAAKLVGAAGAGGGVASAVTIGLIVAEDFVHEGPCFRATKECNADFGSALCADIGGFRSKLMGSCSGGSETQLVQNMERRADRRAREAEERGDSAEKARAERQKAEAARLAVEFCGKAKGPDGQPSPALAEADRAIPPGTPAEHVSMQAAVQMNDQALFVQAALDGVQRQIGDLSADMKRSLSLLTKIDGRLKENKELILRFMKSTKQEFERVNKALAQIEDRLGSLNDLQDETLDLIRSSVMTTLNGLVETTESIDTKVDTILDDYRRDAADARAALERLKAQLTGLILTEGRTVQACQAAVAEASVCVQVPTLPQCDTVDLRAAICSLR